MNLDNFIISEEKLINTPSKEDGCPQDLEVDLRVAGCDQIQVAGQMLKLPQRSIATAQVIFQRFFYVMSFVKFSLFNIAMACIFLGAKVSDIDSLTWEVVHVFYHLKQKQKNTSKFMQVRAKLTDEEYDQIEKIIHDHEFYILTELGFCVYSNLPHESFLEYLAKFDLDKNKQMVMMTWTYMNDSFRTNLCVRYTSETVMCASMFLAAHFLKISLPQDPPWWTEFGADFNDIKYAVVELMNLRARPKPYLNDVERRLSEVKDNYSRKLIESVLSQHLQPSTSDGATNNFCFGANSNGSSHETSTSNSNLASIFGTTDVAPTSMPETSPKANRSSVRKNISVSETDSILEANSIPENCSISAEASTTTKTSSITSSISVEPLANSKTCKSILRCRKRTSRPTSSDTIPFQKRCKLAGKNPLPTAPTAPTNTPDAYSLASMTILGKRKCTTAGLPCISSPTAVKQKKRSNKP